MTTNSGKTSPQDSIESVLEALLKEWMETGLKPKAASRAEDADMADVAEALRGALARTVSQASPFERALLVAALAPALAEALAPTLAEALAPAIVTALSNLAAPKQTSQESASGQPEGA